MEWMQEEVREGVQEVKEVERLEDRVFSLKKGEKKVEELQMMPVVVASQCKSQQDELRER